MRKLVAIPFLHAASRCPAGAVQRPGVPTSGHWIYGVISYAVAQRTHEIGIRLALGAGAREVVRMVIAQGARIAAAGILIGIVASLGLMRLLANLLFTVSAIDPPTFAVVAAVLAFRGTAGLLHSRSPHCSRRSNDRAAAPSRLTPSFPARLLDERETQGMLQFRQVNRPDHGVGRGADL